MPVPDQMMQETPEETAARVERWKAFGEMLQGKVRTLPINTKSVGIINASTKPGYDPLNSLNNLKFTE